MKISIVTVCCNAASSLTPTIESVLAQAYTDLEYIVIDGASTDGTLDLLHRFRDKITIIVSEPDRGIADAFNKGIQRTTGEIVGILNAGDLYHPGTLSAVAETFMDHPDADVVHGNIVYADANGIPLYEQQPDFRQNIIWKKMPYHHPTCFVRRDAYTHYGRFDISYRVAMDYELMLRFYKQGARFVSLNRTLATMCLEGKSDRQWVRGVRESSRAAVQHGMGRMPAFTTMLGRLFRTSLTVCFARSIGITLRQKFPALRDHASAFHKGKLLLRKFLS